MANNTAKQLRAGFETAFIDRNAISDKSFKPQFISNNYKQGKKVISAIESELIKCEEFSFSVAFITLNGITPLLQTLKNLEARGIQGRILTTDYLNFSDPEALRKLNSLTNISIKMFSSEQSRNGFHTKGYIFKSEDVYRIIVGSSNMTIRALTVNREWNTQIVSTHQGEYAGEIINEFELLWNDENTLDFDAFIDDYSSKYRITKEQHRIAKKNAVVSLEQYKLTPNLMQTHFISSLNELLNEGARRALLISATGTGKTYASAFALREMKPRKALFVVHREQIARQAMLSYQNVFGSLREDGSPLRYVLLSGGDKNLEEAKSADMVFATMQTLCKSDIMSGFAVDEFDVICEDEAHHAGADSYQRIMEYFKPGFWLGMTASPDTNRFDVYKIFDNNIAYEIRLQQALEEDLLCPFHYFGITDLKINGEIIGDTDSAKSDKDLSRFNRLVSDIRVDYIIKQAKYYGHCGDRVKGLIFCSRNKEAEELSKKFNERGLRTAVLSGADSVSKREELIAHLVNDDIRYSAFDLDYIFSVDIFSEGIDIPEINQVLMLRPTQSPIVFVQQIGRGLRKAENKDFVVIIDFIGNYKNNFMIPIALSSDRTYNKDNVRHYLREGERIIPGSSTIHFDEISKKRIFEAIDFANFSDAKLILTNYENLKKKLGRIPALLDFDKYGEMDVCRFFDKYGSYHNFLIEKEKDYTVSLSPAQSKIIEFISVKLAPGKRIQELEMLRQILLFNKLLISDYKNDLLKEYELELSDLSLDNVVNVMTNKFPSGISKRTYSDCIFLDESISSANEFGISKEFSEMLKNSDFYCMVEELVKFGISRYKSNYRNKYRGTDFVLYQKYTYEDVCRLLSWEHNEVPLNIGGYKYDKRTKTFPVFINYDKEDNISDSIKYEDHFTGTDSLIAISKSNRSLDSEDVQNFLHAKARGIDVHLFVRKNKDDKISKEFYYLGRMTATGNAKEFGMSNTDKPAVEIEWQLDTPVRDDIYEYILS